MCLEDNDFIKIETNYPRLYQYQLKMNTTTTFYPDSNLTVVLHGTPEGMQKALEAFSAREAAKEAKRARDLELKAKANECMDAILHHQEHTYAIAHPEVYDFCMNMWFAEERKRNQAE